MNSNSSNNNNQVINIIFEDEYGGDIKLSFSPNNTVEEAFRRYMDFYKKSYNSKLDFFYNENLIDKSSNVNLKNMFKNNSIIQVRMRQ